MKDKIILAILLIFLIATNYIVMNIKELYILFILFLFTYAIGFRLQSHKLLGKRIRFFLKLGISLFLFHMLFGMSLSYERALYLSANTVLQISILSQIVFMFSARASLSHMIKALSFLPSQVRLLLTITFSFIPALIVEQNQIELSQKSRGMGYSFKSKLLAPIALVVPLIHRLMERSQTTALSMISRGLRE